MAMVRSVWERPGQTAARLERLPRIRRSDVVAAISCGLDLAEGRPMGHAQRVAYVALAVAETLELDRSARRAVVYASLLHEIGMAAATPPESPSAASDADLALIAAMPQLDTPIDSERGEAESGAKLAVRAHVEHGARLAQRLGFDDDTVRAVRHHHEWWNGRGFPDRLHSFDVPVAARLVAFADLTEQIISDEPNPLAARHRVFERVSLLADQVLDPVIVRNFILVCHDDRFWIEMSSPDLPAILAARAAPEAIRFGEGHFLAFAEEVSTLIDARSGFDEGHSRRVGVLAERLALAHGMAAPRGRQLRIAGVLHDLGNLGVPRRVMSKPHILTVDEMELVREHPRHTHDILARVPGMADAAVWAGAHHERLDGRGYPNQLEGTEIPIEARMIAIADAFDALTSARPHRPAIAANEALALMERSAGTQFDPELLELFSTIARRPSRAGR